MKELSDRPPDAPHAVRWRLVVEGAALLRQVVRVELLERRERMARRGVGRGAPVAPVTHPVVRRGVGGRLEGLEVHRRRHVRGRLQVGGMPEAMRRPVQACSGVEAPAGMPVRRHAGQRGAGRHAGAPCAAC
ncbi:hypothetical protein, partial [Paracidovorax cattleyae]|uniref:hypothetical protein n=1 Tax=Paracidovorax cattleyae TaxID=80868 RepID=UPI001E37BD03